MNNIILIGEAFSIIVTYNGMTNIICVNLVNAITVPFYCLMGSISLPEIL